MEELSFLIVWTVVEDGFMDEHYTHYNDIKGVKRGYDCLIKQDHVHSSSIAIVYKSTDYGGLEDNEIVNDLINANEISQKLVG